MIIKKFQANSETEAIMLAKDELGKDAIVMNIKTISPKGVYKLFRKPLVEITAAVDDTTVYEKQGIPSEKKEPLPERKEKPPEKKIARFNPNIIYEEEDAGEKEDSSQERTDYPNSSFAIEKKLNNLQDLLEKQLIERRTEEPVTDKDKEKQNDSNMEFVQLIYKQLIRNEVDEKFVNQIIGEIEGKLKKDATLDNILSSVYQKIVLKLGQPRTIELNGSRVKFVFFIGPTGVGKTTTIAKIASSLKLGKKAKVALLTSDTYRIAAVEQLRTYANILGIPMKVIYSSEELTDLYEEFREYDVVLVDTAGRSHKNTQQLDDVEEILNSVAEEYRETYLVLSATTKYNDLIRITENYSKISKYRLIFTKLDETISIGNILNIKMLTSADLSYITWGQNVPDDLGRIDPQETAKQLLGGND